MTQLPERVPHQQWNRADVGSVFQHMDSERLPKRIGCDGLGNTRLRGSTPPDRLSQPMQRDGHASTCGQRGSTSIATGAIGYTQKCRTQMNAPRIVAESRVMFTYRQTDQCRSWKYLRSVAAQI